MAATESGTSSSSRLRIQFLGSGRAAADFAPPPLGAELLVGRPAGDVSPDLPLDAPSVSRRHAAIAFSDGEWRILHRVCVHHGSTVDDVPDAMKLDVEKFRQGSFDRPSTNRPIGP